MLHFHSYMEKKNGRNSNIRDDLSLVRAAAWAWFLHGSRSEEKPVPEFDATRTRLQRLPKPSRYKIEAIRQPSLQREYSASSTAHTNHDCVHNGNHSLLDDYEVERISKQLDNLIISSSNRFNGFDNKDVAYPPKGGKLLENKKNKKSWLKGIWLRHSVVCGTREDVDSRALVRSRPLPTAAGGHVRGNG